MTRDEVYLEGSLVKSAALHAVVDRATDWSHYHERFPDAWQGAETAAEILHELLRITE